MFIKSIAISFLIYLSSVSILSSTYDCNNYNFNKEEVKLCSFLQTKKINKKYNVELLQLNQGNIDEVTLRLFKPTHLKKHKANEKRANNTLLKHTDTIYKHIRKYRTVYAFTESKYNVNKEIIAAILTKETWLGKIKPKHDAYSVFYSLYTKTSPDTKRNKWLKNMGKKNVYYISQYCQKHKIKLKSCNFKASYAGAVGFPQFMPMNFWLMKGYKTNKPNLNYMPDAIVSIGSFLKFNKFKTKIDYKRFSVLPKLEEDWYRQSFKIDHLKYFTNKKELLSYSMNKSALKRLNLTEEEKKNIIYVNKYIKRILRYNNSINYAFGVLRIAYEVNKKVK